jgi:hypothetical protein
MYSVLHNEVQSSYLLAIASIQGPHRISGFDGLSQDLKGYLGNWPHYYRIVRSKLVFYNVLTTSINNTHIKRKNSKTICSSETISSWIFGGAPNSPNTRCHLCDLVGLTTYVIVTVIGKSIMLWTKFTSVVHIVKYEIPCRRDWLFILQVNHTEKKLGYFFTKSSWVFWQGAQPVSIPWTNMPSVLPSRGGGTEWVKHLD